MRQAAQSSTLFFRLGVRGGGVAVSSALELRYADRSADDTNVSNRHLLAAYKVILSPYTGDFLVQRVHFLVVEGLIEDNLVIIGDGFHHCEQRVINQQ